MVFSVVVPTFNGARRVGTTLDALLVQRTVAPYEIIVVDNNSSDATRDVISDYGNRVVYVFEREQGISAAKNAGIAVVRGEIVAFIDDDCIPVSGWLDALATTYRTYPDAWAVGGKILPSENVPRWFKDMAHFLGFTDLGDSTMPMDWKSARGGNFSVRASALKRIGPFDPTLGYHGTHRVYTEGEDVEIARRVLCAGGGLYYCGDATVVHDVPSPPTKKDIRRAWAEAGRREALLHGPLSFREALHELSIIGKEIVKMLGCYLLLPMPKRRPSPRPGFPRDATHDHDRTVGLRISRTR